MFFFFFFCQGQRSGTQEALDDPWEPGSHGVWGGGGGWGGGRSQNHTPQRKAKVKT